MAPTPPPSELPKPAAKRTIDYTRSAAPKSPGSGRVADALKTLIWVIPLTVLIWFYAEREQATTSGEVTIPIAVRINSPNKIVTLTDPADGKITVKLSGPRTSVTRLIEDINKSRDAFVTKTIDASTARGPIQLSVSSLGDDQKFASSGITLRDASPQSLQVNVDDLVTQELPVRAQAPENVEGGIRFSPSTVSVTAPRTVFENAIRKAPDGQLYVSADISKLSALQIPGPHENQPGVHVSFESLNKSQIAILPENVSANFVVAQLATDEYVVKNVPIWPAGPESILKSNDIEIQGSKTLASVTVVGPKADIEKFKVNYLARKLDPPFVALIDIDNKDRGDVVKKPATFRLPEGLHVKPDPNLTADVRVSAR